MSLLHPCAVQVGQMKLSAVTLYILSNLPMAYSAVYKELGFKDLILECYLLTFWVSVYQFLVSFLFAPIQVCGLWQGVRSEGGRSVRVMRQQGGSKSRVCGLNLPDSYEQTLIYECVVATMASTRIWDDAELV